MTEPGNGGKPRVTVTVTDGVADVRLNRPEKRNALDVAMIAALVSTGEELKAMPGYNPTGVAAAFRTFDPIYWEANSANWKRDYSRVMARG